MTTLSDLLVSLQQGVQAVQGVSQKLSDTFLQQGTALSSAAPVTALSTITFNSSQAAGFLAVTTSSGVAYYLPLYR